MMALIHPWSQIHTDACWLLQALRWDTWRCSHYRIVLLLPVNVLICIYCGYMMSHSTCHSHQNSIAKLTFLYAVIEITCFWLVLFNNN